MKKPSRSAIAQAPTLCSVRRGTDPIRVCSICGVDVDPDDLPSTIWRECDERDVPLPGDDHILFLGSGKAHEACRKTLNAHPRLYVEETGAPGHFPRLCGPCVFRRFAPGPAGSRALTCAHPDTKANGGAGLKVMLSDYFRGAILCGRNGQIVPVKNAMECVGRKLEEKS